MDITYVFVLQNQVIWAVYAYVAFSFWEIVIKTLLLFNDERTQKLIYPRKKYYIT